MRISRISAQINNPTTLNPNFTNYATPYYAESVSFDSLIPLK